MEDFLKDKKKVTIAVILITLVIIGIALWLRRRKGQESGYVPQRGFFPTNSGGSTPSPTPSTPPPSDSAPSPSPAPPSSAPEPTPDPAPPTSGPDPSPSPSSSYPYPYYNPYYNPMYNPYYYNQYPVYPQPYRSYRPSMEFNKGEYIALLQKQIAALEVEYDNAISDLMFGKAYRLSKKIDALQETLDAQLGY